MSGGRQRTNLGSLPYYYCPPLQNDYRQAVVAGQSPVLSNRGEGYLSLINRPKVRKLIAVGIGRIVYGKKPWLNYFAHKNSCLDGVGLFLRSEGTFRNYADGRLRTVIGVYVKIKTTAHNGNRNGDSRVKVKQNRGNHMISIGDFLHYS